MEIKLLDDVFNSPELSSKLYRFCMDIPEYCQAKEAAEAWLAKLEQVLDHEELDSLEETINNYISWESRAAYLFGVHLRRELCAALMLL